MLSAPTGAARTCPLHPGVSMAGGRACAACLASPPVEEAEEVGFYEAMTDEAKAANMPSRLDAEAMLWSRAEKLSAIADECEAEAKAIKAERGGEYGKAARSTSYRAMLSLAIKARDAAGKDARSAAALIIFRERCSDAERADRLYADAQRAVGRRTGVH